MNLFQRIKKSLLGIPIILFLIGLIFFGIGAGLKYHQLIFQQDALQTTGEVVNLSESCDDDGCTFNPVVLFTTQEGEAVYYTSNFSSNPPAYDIGEDVAIFYKSENPENAIIAGEGDILSKIFMSVGGIVILAGLIFFGVNLKNSYLIEA